MTIHISFGVSDDPLTAYAVVRNLRHAGFSVVRCGCGAVEIEGRANRALLRRLRQTVGVLGVRCDVITSPRAVEQPGKPARTLSRL